MGIFMRISEEERQMKSAADIWEKTKEIMGQTMSSVAIETWFGDVEAIALDDGQLQLLLCVPTEYKRNILSNRYKEVTEKAT